MKNILRAVALICTLAIATIARAAPLSFTLPKASYVTIVIEDGQGNRVRNLVAETKYPAGANTVQWDGRDDSGQAVPAGNYKWRGLYRDALKLEYQFTAYDGNARPPWFTEPVGKGQASGWLSDHHPPCSVAAIGDKVFVGAIVCENGQDLMALDANGNKLWGIAHPYGGVGASVLCADDKYVYGAGEAQWGGNNAFIYRVDPATYQITPLWHHIGHLGLRGLAAHGGKVYVSSDIDNKIYVLDATPANPETARPLQTIALPAPAGLAFTPAGQLLAVSGQSVVVVNVDGTTQPLVTGNLTRPNRMTVGADGTIYVTDGPTSWYRDASDEANTLYGDQSVRFKGDNQVKVFDPQGKFLRAIGTAGGRKPGPYDPQAMRCPVGLAIDNQNRLWVAEYDMLPKRISVWDGATGQLIHEYLGGPKYGGGGALDPGDRTTLIYDGMLFKLDWATGGWKLTDTIVDIMNVNNENKHMFGGYADWPTRIVRAKGQVYYVNDGQDSFGGGNAATLWVRRGADFVAVAHVGPYQPLPIINNEPNRNDYLFPRLTQQLGDVAPGGDSTDIGGPIGKWNGFTSFVMLWADSNGDGVIQPDEVTFSDKPAFWNAAPIVGADLAVYLRSPSHRNRLNMWRLPLAGINAQGAPQYDMSKLQTLWQGAPDTTGGSITAMAADGADRAYTLGRPIYGYDPVSKTHWTYPDAWPGFGSGSPLPQPGLIIAGWGMRGATDYGGVIGGLMAINSDYGQWYLFSGDGLFISTLFGDTRTAPFWGAHFTQAVRGMDAQGVSLGQESFSGSMVKSSDGNVYIVAGHPHVSIMKVAGLDSVRRLSGGTVLLKAATPGSTVTAVAQSDLIVRPIDGYFGQAYPTAIIKNGDNEAARVWLEHDGQSLHVFFKVTDASPLKNAGTDPKLLFKTGDSVDVQLGLDPKADPHRTLPVPGDIRLLLTKTAAGTVAVLYRYKVPGTTAPERFWSPTGEVLVDKIEILKDLKIDTTAEANGYTLTTAIPWKLLGGDDYVPPFNGTLRGDVGVLSSDPDGQITVLRTYLFNKQTNIVADIPSEIRLHPDSWGQLKLVLQ